MHTTTGLRFMRALADRGEAIPTYLERLEAGARADSDPIDCATGEVTTPSEQQ